MPTNKAIIISVAAYVVVFIGAALYYTNMKVTGDAAGKGLEKGYAFIFGVGMLLLIGVIMTVIFLFFFKELTGWVKLLAFVPLLLPLMVVGVEYFDIGKKKLPSEDDQRHRITLEVRSIANIDGSTIMVRKSSGSSASKLKYIRSEDGFRIYEKTDYIYYYHDAKFSIYNGDVIVGETELDIPQIPEETPFSEWKIFPLNESTVDSIRLEFRFMVEKAADN